MNKKLILLILSLLGVMSLHAQNIIRPKVECPNGIYVNSYNGVLFYQRPDVSVANRNMRLEAVFYYNSSSNTKNYGYGNGWSLGSELRFVNDSLGVIIEQGDGRQDLYTRYGNSFEAPAGVFSTLSIDGDGYLLTYKDGTKYYFADTVAKKVTMVKDRYDNAITFTYQDGNLASASDISGRSLYFSWSNDLLSGLSTSFDDRTWSYQYDENGNLTSVTDPMGYTVHYAYNKDNRIKTFTDAEGYSTHISYNTDGMAHRVKTDVTDKSIRYELAKRQTIIVDYLKDANNQFSTYYWDEKGRVIEKMGNCCGFSSKLAYDDDNNIVLKEDANGNVTTYTYDQNGNMLSATDALGNTDFYTYENTFNNPTSYTDKMGHTYTFTYDINGNLTAITTPLNTTIQYTYNQFGQVLTETDANNNTTVFGYDEFGNLISKTNALNQTTTMTHTAQGLLETVVYPNSGMVYYEYDRLNRMIHITNPLDNTISLDYDKKGTIVRITDPMSYSTVLTPNALGQIIQVTDPLNGVNHYTYNAKGKVLQSQDALHHVTRYLYDEHDWLTMSIDASEDTTRYYYDNIGQVIGLELPSGRFITYQYDVLNRLISIADQLGTTETYEYDANNNIISKTDAEGNSMYFQYDAMNRLIQVTDAMGLSEYFVYDNNDNLISYSDRNGNTTLFTFNALNRLLTKSDAINNVTTYAYDSNGNLSSVTDALGGITSYQYDANNQLTKITFANNKTQQFNYDAQGRIAIFTNESGNQMGFEYDALGRMTKKTYPNQTTDSFTYNAIGHILTANNTDAQVSFTYDDNGRILSETLNGETTNYAYDIKNRKIMKTYPCGRTITEEYDIRERLTEVKENNSSIMKHTYFSNNYLSQRTYGNSISIHFVFDALNRLIQQYDNSNVFNVQMTYDALGNLLSEMDLLNPTKSETYNYDAINRLTNFKLGEITSSGEIPNPLKNVQYEMDALGNRTTVNENGVVTNYTANGMNAYTSIMGGQNIVPQYDDNGNMTNDDTHTYQYNYNNQLISVDNGQTATYKYDAFNRRIQKTIVSTSSTINYYYSGNQVIEEHDVNNMVVTTYVFGLSVDDVLQMKKGDNTYYYHKNRLGSVMALTDCNGDVVEYYMYDPYGHPSFYDDNFNAIEQSIVGNTILFTGRDFDKETNLYYYRSRTMHPGLGRFMQYDPLLFVDGFNLYSYVNNNPLFFTDQFGLSKECSQNGNCDGNTMCLLLRTLPKAIGTVGKIQLSNAIKGYCEQHPKLCRLRWGWKLTGNACAVGAFGACGDISLGFEIPIINTETYLPNFTKVIPYIEYGATASAGVELDASVSLSLTVSDPEYVTHSGPNNYLDFAGNIEYAGLGAGIDYTIDDNHDTGLSFRIPFVELGEEETHSGEFKSAHVGLWFGAGIGAHGGYRMGGARSKQ